MLSPLQRRGSIVPATPHIGKPPGGGVLATVEMWLLSPMAVLTLFFAVMSMD